MNRAMGATTTTAKSKPAEKQHVALVSVLAAAAITTLKVVVGLATGSLGILSDAAHSGLDLLATIMTYFSVRVSDRPADDSHPYGHGKVENLSAFAEILLLIVTCVWITVEAVRRFLMPSLHVVPTIWAFAVMGVSMIVDVVRSRALGQVARKYSSQALEVDAFHFAADIFSSGVVIVGLFLVVMARATGRPWLEFADPVAALAVAAIVAVISVRMGLKTIDTLVDAAPKGVERRIEKAIAGVDEVVRMDRIRVRQSGSQMFVDLRLTLAGNITFEHAQAVTGRVESSVLALFPEADVVIHALPEAPPAGDLVERIRAIAHRGNFHVHDVMAYAVRGKPSVHLDLEVDPTLTLLAAHTQATQLEKEIRRDLGEESEINIQMEPRPARVEAANEAPRDEPLLQSKLFEMARTTPGLLDCHSVVAHEVGGAIVVHLHCTLDPDLPIERIHDITEDLKFRLRAAFPRISKVSIHAEPRGSDD